MTDLRRAPRRAAPSPRHLARRHARARLDPTTKDAPQNIAAGEEQLYSFFVPGLQAGLHTIDVLQKINVDPNNPTAEKKDLSSSHGFNVIGPRFSLPEGALDSFYPPQGHADRGEVLPSVVFNDPTLPWERQASSTRLDDFNRNRVPWLAVLLFTQDELRLSPPELKEVFADPSLASVGQQGDTLSSTMLVRDVQKLKSTNTKAILYDENADGKDAKTDIIFLRPELFNALFSKYDGNGNRVSTKVGNEERCYVSHHRFLAHLRHVRLEGSPAAAATDSLDHVYSVVFSHRTGPLSIEKPTPVVAHLVNIEGIEAMKSSIDANFVSLSSLYSWEYTCLPPNSLDVEAAFEHLGDGLNVLRPKLEKADLDNLGAAGAVGLRVKQRMQDGFSMLRYRTQTGEVTAAFTRSPFTPSAVKFPEGTPWPPSSTTGTKLQILDPALNVMDLTYSTAWNLGKTLGLAHPEFAVALSRVRKQIFDQGLQDAQDVVIKERSKALGIPPAYKTNEEILATLASTVTTVAALPERNVLPRKEKGMVHRWHRPELPHLDLSYQGPEVQAVISDSLKKAAKKIAGSVEDPEMPYNEDNTPYSTDWMIVLHWVIDRYHLIDVPAHYLITDPACVPPESLRFFTIDHNWVMAMIDGGLSLANHLDQTDDQVRNAMKWAINWHLTTKLPGLDYYPTTPSYGFYVRSELVTKFPDLIVDLEPAPSGEKQAPVVLRHEVVDRGTMLCLMREPPAEPEFTSLFLREPPHQQYFSAAAEITAEQVDVEYTRIYTTKGIPDDNHREGIEYTAKRKSPQAGRSIFIWGSANEVRCMNVENFAIDYQRELNKKYAELQHPEWYEDKVPNAAMMAIQFTEPQWQVEVALKTPSRAMFSDLFKPDAYLSRRFRVLDLPSIRSASAAALPVVGKLSSTIASSPHPAFGNRHRHSPLKLKYAPPHFRPPRPDHSVVLSDTQLATSMASAPEFEYNVYPVGQKPGAPIPITRQRQDLVFSIVLRAYPQDFEMQSLEIQVKLQPPKNQLMDRYNGAGPSMLSNLRFNILARLSTDGTVLVLTLKPRSTTGVVPVGKIDDLSFLLSGVIVHQFQNNARVELQAYEQYKNQARYPQTIECNLVKPESG